MPTVNLAETEETGRVNLPTDVYGIRIIETEQRQSKKGNPMLVLTYEICDPPVVTLKDGAKIRVQGLQLRDYIVLQDSGLSRLKALHVALGLPLNVDTDNLPVNDYRGKAFQAILKTEVDVMKKSGTEEPILNPETGAPFESYNYRVEKLLARLPAQDRAMPF